MDLNLDLRVQKTYSSLINAFFEILEEKSINQLTVNELCQKANVRRPTFYKHFSDKYAFIKFVAYTTQKELLKEIDTQTEMENPFDFFLTCFEKFLDLVEQYQNVLVRLEMELSTDFSFEIIDNYLQPQIEKRILSFEKKGAVLAEDIGFTCQIILGIFRQTSIWWLKPENHLTKLEIRNHMAQVLHLLFPII